ncbi:hypothetical protein CORC01_14370 [Colletotrichum orchidophilum]|uniref:Uncharacterized protein n=1 Tax=Colletotrichum orchidophilum TaxID=1209926 RepID=A0A1G4AMR4_9PEZI|nr:uncharacterized protein CORC01_14370 [Colletotrichum orchidophilum]OHE90333.1 hypothetical protein CORC01_14370 [Colletotrichum orchidophilum]
MDAPPESAQAFCRSAPNATRLGAAAGAWPKGHHPGGGRRVGVRLIGVWLVGVSFSHGVGGLGG